MEVRCATSRPNIQVQVRDHQSPRTTIERSSHKHTLAICSPRMFSATLILSPGKQLEPVIHLINVLWGIRQTRPFRWNAVCTAEHGQRQTGREPAQFGGCRSEGRTARTPRASSKPHVWVAASSHHLSLSAPQTWDGRASIVHSARHGENSGSGLSPARGHRARKAWLGSQLGFLTSGYGHVSPD